MSETIRWVGLLFPRIPTRELTKDCMELKFNSSVSIEVFDNMEYVFLIHVLNAFHSFKIC